MARPRASSPRRSGASAKDVETAAIRRRISLLFAELDEADLTAEDHKDRVVQLTLAEEVLTKNGAILAFRAAELRRATAAVVSLINLSPTDAGAVAEVQRALVSYLRVEEFIGATLRPLRQEPGESDAEVDGEIE